MTRMLLPFGAALLFGSASCEPPVYGNCPFTCPAIHSSCDLATTDDGKCICDPGYTPCGEACVSLLSDQANCGACNNACDTTNGYTCINADCICGDGPFGLCPTDGGPDVCSDPTTDRHNCGACGNDCGLLECLNRACTCTAPLDECATTLPDGGAPYCADLGNDLDNCGKCGAICGPPLVSHDARAKAWQCISTMGGPGGCACKTGYFPCQASPTAPADCVDLSTSAQNCGACNNACAGGACNNSRCGCSAPGYVLCPTAALNDPFACHLPESTVTHCGNASGDNCGTDCTTLGIHNPICNNGACACLLNMDAGSVCGLDAGLTPFCTDLSSDPGNCGSCFAPLTPPFNTCASGRPSCDISTGEQLCQVPDASFCANLNRGDPMHCGACAGPSSECATWNGADSLCFSSACHCAEDIDDTPHAPDAGPAAHCIASASQAQCSCNVSQTCSSDAAPLSWGADIFPLFQTGPGGVTSASKLGCTASGCHTGGAQVAAGHLDLSDLDAGYTGLMTGPIFSGKPCTTPPGPATAGAFNCPCVAQVTPGATDPANSVLISLVATGNYPQKCASQLVHSDAAMNRLIFSPCAQLIIANWIDAGANP